MKQVHIIPSFISFWRFVGLVVLAALIHPTHAYPDLIEEFADCADHPPRSEVYPHHWFVLPDPTGTAWTAYLGDELLDKHLCPGHTHTITVSYTARNGAPDKRRSLLTSSLGSIRAPNGAESDRGYLLYPGCENRILLAPHATSLSGHIESDEEIFTSYTVLLRLPCNAAGRTVILKSSSATHECLSNCGYSNVLVGNWTVPVNPACAAPACRPPGPPPPPRSPPRPRPPSPRPPPPPPLPPSPRPPPPSPPPPSPSPPPSPPPPSPWPPVDTSAPSPPPSNPSPPLPPPPSPPPPPPPSPPPPPPPPPPSSPQLPPPPEVPEAPEAPSSPPSPRPPRPSPSPPRPPFPPLEPLQQLKDFTQDPPMLPTPPQPPAPPAACESSSLGYTCSKVLGRVTLHWTVGGAAPPANKCTGPGSSAQLQGQQQGQLVHFAVESAVSGYVSIGFPVNPAKMYDADMVLGWVGADGRGVVDAYHVTSYEMTSADIVKPSWALGAAVVEDRAADGSPRTTMCFSRAVSEPRALSSPVLDVKGILKYSWAISGNDALVEHPDYGFGAGLLDLSSGAATEAHISSRRGAIIAHGVLMSVAWVLLLPLGAMAPAHRWVFGGRQLGGKAVWYGAHLVLQLSGFAAFAAGFILAMVRFRRPAANTLNFSHAVMGYVVAGLAGLQVIIAFLRPDPGTRLREMLWNPLHKNGGRAATLLAWATVFTGIAVHHDPIYQGPIVPWVVPIAVVMGLLLLLDPFLRDVRARQDAVAARAAAAAASTVATAGAAGAMGDAFTPSRDVGTAAAAAASTAAATKLDAGSPGGTTSRESNSSCEAVGQIDIVIAQSGAPAAK